MPELFLEIGAEEIPSRFMSLALDHLKVEMSSFLKKIEFKPASLELPDLLDAL